MNGHTDQTTQPNTDAPRASSPDDLNQPAAVAVADMKWVDDGGPPADVPATTDAEMTADEVQHLERAYDAFYRHGDPELSDRHLDLLADDMTNMIIGICDVELGTADGIDDGTADDVIDDGAADDVDDVEVVVIGQDSIPRIVPRQIPPIVGRVIPPALPPFSLNERQWLALGNALCFLQTHAGFGNDIADRFARDLISEFQLTPPRASEPATAQIGRE